MTKHAVGNKVLVIIDKKLKNAKLTLQSGLHIPPQYEYMMYNLQYGRIVSVGEGVKDPDIKVGRIAILHHTVEANQPNLVEKKASGDELRVVRVKSDISSYQLFGVFGDKNEVIPFGHFIFCDPPVKPEVKREHWKDPNTGLTYTAKVKKVGSLYIPVIPKPEDEETQLTLVVQAVSKEEELMKPGDTILADSYSKYPIDLYGRTYWIIQREYVTAILKKAETKTKAAPTKKAK